MKPVRAVVRRASGRVDQELVFVVASCLVSCSERNRMQPWRTRSFVEHGGQKGSANRADSAEVALEEFASISIWYDPISPESARLLEKPVR